MATTTAPSLPAGEFRTGGLTIKLGGFVEVDGIYRSRNEVADLGTSFNGIPLPNSPRYHENGLRGTVRHSRVTMLVQGKPDDVTTLTGYGAVDFEGAAETANSNQSNSYNPRIRQLWASYDRGDLGLEVVGRSGLQPSDADQERARSTCRDDARDYRHQLRAGLYLGAPAPGPCCENPVRQEGLARCVARESADHLFRRWLHHWRQRVDLA